jgi:hypothetical protein
VNGSTASCNDNSTDSHDFAVGEALQCASQVAMSKRTPPWPVRATTRCGGGLALISVGLRIGIQIPAV